MVLALQLSVPNPCHGPFVVAIKEVFNQVELMKQRFHIQLNKN
jgi:hypothetical protein